MGGRGASSGGRRGRAPVGYRTTGFSSGIRIVRNIKTDKGLPRKSFRPNEKYFGTDSSGKIIQLRVFDKNKNAKMDIEWSHSFEGHPAGTVHYHVWKNGIRSKEHNKLPVKDVIKYKDLIEKASQRDDLKW